MAANPYRDLPDHQFWSRSMSWPAPAQIDPMTTELRIAPGERVVTLGSCFAQHLAQNLARLGLNYHIAEAPPESMPESEARDRNYGVFSARFGNVYTVRQAVQLYERAFGIFVPEDDVWEAEGGFVDAFRPLIEAKPFPSEEAVRQASVEHLAAVRRMFEEADWLIFTLGLTEGWRSRADGAVYPLAPGVAAGRFDPGRYEFVNFNAQAVQQDLARFLDLLAKRNPTCRVILTVSPVPLIATYEKRHVLVSTTYSKSVLRVACDEIERMYKNVTYFPSYEIITSPANGGAYYADDLREVTPLGVKHVMRVFKKHCVGTGRSEASGATFKFNGAASLAKKHATERLPYQADQKVICDEELIETALRNTTEFPP